MDINYILENKEWSKLLKDSISKTYNRYKLHFILDIDDFTQEVQIRLMKRIVNFNSERSSLRSFIPLVVMSQGKETLRIANGQSKNWNKIDIKNKSISLDNEFSNENCDNVQYSDLVGNCDNTFDRLLINEIVNLKSLSKKEKEILILMSEGYEIKDICKMLCKTYQCVNITFLRAKEKIVKKYSF